MGYLNPGLNLHKIHITLLIDFLLQTTKKRYNILCKEKAFPCWTSMLQVKLDFWFSRMHAIVEVKREEEKIIAEQEDVFSKIAAIERWS